LAAFEHSVIATKKVGEKKKQVVRDPLRTPEQVSAIYINKKRLKSVVMAVGVLVVLVGQGKGVTGCEKGGERIVNIEESALGREEICITIRLGAEKLPVKERNIIKRRGLGNRSETSAETVV